MRSIFRKRREKAGKGRERSVSKKQEKVNFDLQSSNKKRKGKKLAGQKKLDLLQPEDCTI